ncbi:MAG: hypothetical protein M1820_004296 [Bogoriella megaspora]|nr:MAG: hypothetical protein M1820_004296 [Bogoriella megaspora]
MPLFLPSFRGNKHATEKNQVPAQSQTENQPPEGYGQPLSHTQIKRATRARLIWALISSFFLLVALVFLILVEVGDTSIGRVTNSIYFLNLDLSQIVPQSVPDAVLINSVAQSLGLHDFYTVGLWGYCEGYFSEGVTFCSKPRTLYWFNPVEILVNELLNGASIALPTQATTYLHILKTASQWMFGLFLSGACLTFVLIFLSILTIYSRWATLLIGIFTLLNAIIVTVATVLGTAIFVILQIAFESVDELNIKADIGNKMFAFMWIAAGSTIIAWIIHTGMCCCCTSRRDVKRGRKRGSRHAYTEQQWAQAASQPEPEKRGLFGRRK